MALDVWWTSYTKDKQAGVQLGACPSRRLSGCEHFTTPKDYTVVTRRMFKDLPTTSSPPDVEDLHQAHLARHPFRFHTDVHLSMKTAWGLHHCAQQEEKRQHHNLGTWSFGGQSKKVRNDGQITVTGAHPQDLCKKLLLVLHWKFHGYHEPNPCSRHYQ